MRRFAIVPCLSLAIVGGLATAPAARAEDRSAEAIVKEINAVELPKLTPEARTDRTAMAKFRAAYIEGMTRKAALIGELYKKDPKNPALARLMPERWNALAMTGKTDEVKKEVDALVSQPGDNPLKPEALFVKAALSLRGGDPAEVLKGAEAFIKAAPKDERGAMLLYQVASQSEDSGRQTALYKRIAKDFPASRFAKMVEGSLKQKEAVGKPFDIDFTDAIKGTEVSTKTLKGKVVVVDFWATWCGPCVAEMPNMKKLYSEYKDKGVEFIGVSLDAPKEDGGLDSLKKFVAEKQIGWPQYYDGKTSARDFATSWGITAIPTVFIIDADGKLHSTEARGKLETLIPELLKKSKGKTDAGAGGQG